MDEQSLRPWDWCDRRCERCPLALECAVNLRVEEQKREAARRGFDPDDPNVTMTMVMESFREAFVRLAAESGTPEDDGEEELEAVRTSELYEAGLRYARAVEEVCSVVEGRDLALVDEARLIGMILVGKTARLIDRLPLRRDSFTRDDVVLTLMLISHLEKQAAALVMALGAEWKVSQLFGFRRARRELRRLLDVHLEGIRRSERDFVERMVAAGRAPSPFCIAVGPPLSAA
jgi:hypothetical protein